MRRAVALLAAVLVLAACGGGGDDDATTTSGAGSSTSAASSDPTTVAEPTTSAAPTTTDPAAPTEPPSMWSSGAAFLAELDTVAAGITDGNPEAVPVRVPADVATGVTTEAPGYGAFGAILADGVTVGGLDRLDDDGEPGGAVVGTVLVARQANEASTTALAAYLTLYETYHPVDLAPKLTELLGSGDPEATVDVASGPLVVRMSRSGDDPVNDPVIIVRVFLASEADVADALAPAVSSVTASAG